MKFSIKYLLLFALAAALLAGCRKDSSDQTDIIIPPDPTVKIQTGVMGLVVDETGTPLEAATVRLGSSQIQTDENGFFELNGLANEIQPFVRVEKAGYFPSLVSFSAKAGHTGRVKVGLRTKTLAGQITAGAGGQVDVPGGGSIQFAADGFVDANGNAYAGSVLVYATYLDPSKPETDNMIPGSFLGQTTGGETQILRSFGMIHALLESPAGAKLQLSKPAQMTVPVPADRLSKAPAEIPLWYIDEATSIWKEEGKAALDGNVYKGQVSHFSWWNCDDGFPIIRLSGILRIGNEYPYVEIRITRPDGTTAVTVPTATGYFTGGVPANETLLFEVLNECGEVVHSQTIGPFGSDTDLGIISVIWTSDWVEIEGTLLNCDQDPVTNGYVQAWTNGQATGYFPVHVNSDGTFSGIIANCSGTDVSVIGYDIDGLKASGTVTQPVAPRVLIGDLIACDVQITTGVLIEFGNGTEKFIDNATAVIESNPTTPNVYRITTIDDQGNGNKVQYEIALLDWNQNPANPLWGASIQNTLFGQPVYYQINTQGGTIEAIQQGTQPGELVIFKMSNVILSEFPGNTTYPNSTITITAILQ